MKPKIIMVIVLAGIAVAGYVAIQLLPRQEAMVTVIVAKKEVPQWTLIREPHECFERKEVEKKAAREHFIPAADFDRLVGRRLRTSIGQGETLTGDALLDPSMASMSGGSRKGWRAVAVHFSADKAVASQLGRGSSVDLMHVVDGRSESLVEDVVILAVDLETSTATLQMALAEAQKVNGAKDQGTFSLRPAVADSRREKKDDVGAVVPPPPPPQFSTSPILREGMRSLTIPIHVEKGLSFWVVPGTSVDVVHTANGRSQLLLENVMVLAIDLNTDKTPHQPGVLARTATLELSPVQVDTISRAKEKGTVSLVMRPAGELEEKKPEGGVKKPAQSEEPKKEAE